MAEILEGEHVVNFTWFTNIDLPQGISSVEVILASARSVWDDQFTDINNTQSTVSYDLALHNGVFSTRISLKTNIYHFLFRINNTNDFTVSHQHDVTYLANGRMLNYVNVGDVVLKNKHDWDKEGSPLRSPVASGADTNELINRHHREKASGLRRLFLCCSY